ncbi:hypothetical protein QJQ45_027426 [Haematococcus lacustris]|nr:hypothetical protein QJQ45_027426 [Haematococcus lacustris]
MDAQQKTLSSIPLLLFYPALLALVGGAGAAGMVAGRGLPGCHGLCSTVLCCVVVCGGAVEPENKQAAAYIVGAVGAAAAAAVSIKVHLQEEGWGRAGNM